MPPKKRTTKTTTRRRRIRGGASSAPQPPGGPSEGLGLVIDNSVPYTQPSDAFLASVMQGPIPSGGNVFQRAWRSLRDARLISRGLRAVGLRGLADRASQAGLGKKKRRVVRRKK